MDYVGSDWPHLISPLRSVMLVRNVSLDQLAARCTNITRERLVEFLRCEVPTEDESTALAFSMQVKNPNDLYREPVDERAGMCSLRWHDPDWSECCWCGLWYPSLLCDAPVPLREKSREYSTLLLRRTCSAHICDGCATDSGDGDHLCPEHRGLKRQAVLF